ncbi:MAG: beta-ketoacyl-ACP synthase III [Bacillota bacterium]|jgi:3-oxoacyl-[acyl-carrier-protein] synthase-3|nr:beta-ketoacyl-ACP synthase III [Bacillota bacterium]
MKENAISAGFFGTGHFVPERVLTNADLEKMVDTSDEWIVTRSGIRERRIADESMTTSDMCYEASLRALADGDVNASELDLIIVCTVTPDYAFPSVSCLLQDRLGASRAAAFDLSAGCTGFVYGVVTAAQFIGTGLYKKVLVVGAEMLSSITNWKDRSTCVLFGDGAGAAVMGPCEKGSGLLSAYLGSDGSLGPLLCLPAGGTKEPITEEAMALGRDKLYMEGSEVFKVAVRHMEAAIRNAVEAIGEEVSAIDLLIPHQANRRIIDAVNKKIGLPEDNVVINLDRYGNTSAASVPIALSEAVQDGRLQEGDLLVMTSFGAGMTWGAVAVRWNKKELS